MAISIGIRLVMIFPTLLFLISCCFKSVIEKNDFEDVHKINRKIGGKLQTTFLFMLSIDSLFLFLANGLIIIFEFQVVEVGIIAIISGIIVSLCLLIYTFSNHVNLGTIGILGIFGGLCGELAYFIVSEPNTILNPFLLGAIFLGVVLGFGVGWGVLKLASPSRKTTGA